MQNDPTKNAEGYSDPTAFHGLKPVIKESEEQQKRINTLIFILKHIIKISGFELLNRIEVRDCRTGKEYR